MNSKLREYNQLLQRLKFLIERNRGDSEDADYVRDLMVECWRGLSADECNEAQKSAEKMNLTEEV